MISLLLKVFDGFFTALNKFMWFAEIVSTDEDVKKAAKAEVVVETRDQHTEVVKEAASDKKALKKLRKMASE